jgi:hypothetical protein
MKLTSFFDVTRDYPGTTQKTSSTFKKICLILYPGIGYPAGLRSGYMPPFPDTAPKTASENQIRPAPKGQALEC